MSCQWAPDYPIAGNVTYSQFSASIVNNLVCAATYLRPDPGGAMLPFLYTLFLLLFHLPACLIRAVRWESAQYLALGLALFNIAVTIQSYISTKMEPSKILIWMPLTIILDIGAMLQMIILILELPGHQISSLNGALIDQIARIWRIILDGLPNCRRKPMDAANQADVDDMENDKQRKVLVGHALVALFAAIFGVLLLVLQIYGLVAARKGMGAKNLTVNWCSPTFRDFTLAVTTGNCAKYNIIGSSSNGIGCIALPASQQEDWLKGTFATLLTCLILEVIDLVIVKFAKRTNDGNDRLVNGTRLRRPWCSMFGGTLILIILIYYGADTANRLPPGVTDLVWIYSKEPRSDFGRVCQLHLRSPGLRGMIIGWTDGVFSSWGSVYNGRESV